MLKRSAWRSCAPYGAVIALLLFATASFAGPPSPYIGFYPFYGYRGFYSNGYSMYGPPVPTYAPVPGVFGGSDQRLGNFAYPPPVSWNRANPRAYAPAAPLIPGAPSTPAPLDIEPNVPTLPAPRPLPGNAAASVEVRVPDGAADVFFDGRATQQTGARRLFESPPLARGKSYSYEVRARWQENGQEVVRNRSVAVEPGQKVLIDFTQAEPAVQVRRP